MEALEDKRMPQNNKHQKTHFPHSPAGEGRRRSPASLVDAVKSLEDAGLLVARDTHVGHIEHDRECKRGQEPISSQIRVYSALTSFIRKATGELLLYRR